MEDSTDISEAERVLISELFNSLEVAHTELASACNTLSRLSWKLRPQQLMTVLRDSVCPLIQVNMAASLLKPPAPSKRHNLPGDQYKRVKMLMIPDPVTKSLKMEKMNSPTSLIAVAWVFKILNKFGNSMTQRSMQELYSIHAKQLTTCISRKKYLGDTDRKCKALGTDEGPSTSKKPTTELNNISFLSTSTRQE